MSICGGLFAGPLFHYYYTYALPFVTGTFLPQKFSFLRNLNKFQNIMLNMVFDQTVWAFSFLFSFFIVMDVLDGGSLGYYL